MKLGKRPCETCPHRQPMNTAHWNRIAHAQRQATPELSRSVCAKLTRIERKQFEGLEANVENCEGYSPLKAISNYLLGKVSVAHSTKRTEAGGLRNVSWHERTCNNPYLDSPEYFELQDEFQAVGSEGTPDKSSMFKTDRQREAFIDDNIATTRMMSGVLLTFGGVAIVEAAPEPISTAGTALFGYGMYRAVTGGIDLFKALRVQVQEHRNNP